MLELVSGQLENNCSNERMVGAFKSVEGVLSTMNNETTHPCMELICPLKCMPLVYLDSVLVVASHVWQ